MNINESIKNRNFRRTLVLTTYISYPILVLLFAVDKQLPNWLTIVLLFFVGIILLCSVGILINSQFHKWANAQQEELDERELQIRHKAGYSAYTIISALFFISSVYYAVALGSQDGRSPLWYPNNYEQANAIVWGVLILAFTLPTAILAWLEPDPIQDELAVLGEVI